MCPVIGPLNSLGLLQTTGINGDIVVGPINFSQSGVMTGIIPANFLPSGSIGPTGTIGPQGATGVAGPQGAQGVQGNQGIQGATGVQGIQGLQGSTGSIGSTGTIGATGPTGPMGNTGPQGATGIQGGVGPTGSAGTNGGQIASIMIYGGSGVNNLMTNSNQFYGLQTMVGTSTLFLPSGVGANPDSEYLVKDVYGTLSPSNILLVSAPKGYLIDGQTGFLMYSTYGAYTFFTPATGYWGVL